ncbi:hypothetical protein BBP40_012024 [Aspergillus hancockii]|nr:hypothetical protein BBP40_012024 [Aspergillus hancockii]
MQLLLDEVLTLFNGGKNLLEDVPFIESPTWAKDISEEDLRFWTTYLDGLPTVYVPLLPQYSTDRKHYHGTSSMSVLPVEVSERLKDYTRHTGVTLQLSVAVVALALQPGDGGIGLLMGAPHLNYT